MLLKNKSSLVQRVHALLPWVESWLEKHLWWVATAMLAYLFLGSSILHALNGWKEIIHALMVWGGWPVFFIFTVLYNVLFVPFPYDPFLLSAPWLIPGHSVSFVWLVATSALTAASVADVILGQKIGHMVRPWLMKQKGYPKCEKAVHKYGIGAVGLSALTPIPFSLVCWVAGMAELSPWGVGLVTFLSRGLRCALVLWVWGG
jgi:membrane protein YqaA with SNARE-associated domain